ncbi:MAG TPA: hypothetical protein VGK31_05270 [Thermoanaerobaculia bacterium]
MKRIAAVVVALAFVSEVHAGITYRFESVTEAASPHVFTGVVKADQGKVRMEVVSGADAQLIFEKGSVVLSSSGSGILTVLNPSKKTYYEMDLGHLLAGAATFMSTPYAKIDVKNPRVSVSKKGSGGSLQGFPTTRSTIDSSFDMVLKMMGETKPPIRLSMTTEVWSTDRLPATAANVIESIRVRTGVESLDKMIDAQTSGVVGFPLKQVTTTRITMNGSTTTGRTRSQVTDIRQSSFAASEFAVPAGFTKVDNPLEAKLNELR